jgi:hypothetical protein
MQPSVELKKNTLTRYKAKKRLCKKRALHPQQGACHRGLVPAPLAQWHPNQAHRPHLDVIDDATCTWFGQITAWWANTSFFFLFWPCAIIIPSSSTNAAAIVTTAAIITIYAISITDAPEDVEYVEVKKMNLIYFGLCFYLINML